MSSKLRELERAGIDAYRGAPPDFFQGLKVRGMPIEEFIDSRVNAVPAAPSSGTGIDVKVVDLSDTVALANDTAAPMLIIGAVLVVEQAANKATLTLDGVGVIELDKAEEVTDIPLRCLLAPGESIQGQVKGKASGRLVVQVVRI